MLRLTLPVAILCSSLLLTSEVRASGSVTLTAASKDCSLTIRQNFRKILPAGRASGYYDSVREEFRTLLAQQLPRLSPLMAQRSNAPRFELHLGAVSCAELVCPRLTSLRFPALVTLPPFRVPGHSGHEYLVQVPFRSRPGATQLGELSKSIQKILDSRSIDTPSSEVVRAEPIGRLGSAFSLTVRMQIEILGRDRAFFSKQLTRLSKRLSQRLKLLLQSPPGLRFGKYKAALPSYRDGGALPARMLFSRSDARYFVDLQLAVSFVESDGGPAALIAAVNKLLNP